MLHGFLGSSADWSLVLKALETKGIAADVLRPEFFRAGPLSAEHGFEEWTRNLLAETERRFNGEPVHLLGYSLGGRLALHAAFAQPSRWKSLWIFSSNPGVFFAPPEERAKWERETARKFVELPWDTVMKEWNQLDVFSRTAPRMLPKEDQFERELLAKALTGWSVTKHRFAVPDIQSLPLPIQWWFGENDLKFLDVKRELERQNIPGGYRIAPKAGHRITLDRPDLIADALAELVGDSK
jgi:2-succinyl-6-hydroxy-2,4-cyclohexadiene-1-carboxylate synthase